ncbi:MAG: thiamine pyrophosphate-binding protein [Fibrobacter sp.]|nr:thiamine pyrophosphate-binding protein [Fibrobacter sp.]
MALATEEFVARLIEKGFNKFCVVPCSFAKNLINEVINNPKAEYIPCASEAVAVSIAAGLRLSGEKPVVVVQSSGMTNMGSCITSLLKPYGVNVPVLTSWRTYTEGSSEIQHEHLATDLPKLINAYGYEHYVLDTENIDNAINQVEESASRPLIGIIPKNSFSAVDLKPEFQLDLEKYLPRSVFLNALNQKFKASDVLFIGTTGNTAREMYSFMPDLRNFYMAGNMGGALSLGLGAAMSGQKVVICGGDAEFLMHLGGLTTAGRYQNLDLSYIVFDNEANKSTGGQSTQQSHINYNKLARASGFSVLENTITTIEEFKKEVKELSGLKFMHVKCAFDPQTPRPPLEVIRRDKFV